MQENNSDYPETLAINDDVALRLSTPADADILLAWTADPAVYTWWEGRPLTRAEVEAKYVGTRAPGVIAYIIEHLDAPVGFIQAWRETGSCGLDMFLSAEGQGRGIGSATARALATDLTKRGWHNITVDPAVDNEAAIRAWRKAGFVPSGQYGEDNGHQTLIMKFAAN